MAKLTLKLPRFGLWMPESYWAAFEEARGAPPGRQAVMPERVRKLATDHRAELEGGGLAREVANIRSASTKAGSSSRGKPPKQRASYSGASGNERSSCERRTYLRLV